MKKGAVKEKKEKAANAEQQEMKELLRSLKETCRCLPHQHKQDLPTVALGNDSEWGDLSFARKQCILNKQNNKTKVQLI